MGLCVNIFGIPILEDRECADNRRSHRTDRLETRKDARVEKVKARQGGRTDRTVARQDASVTKTALRNADGTTPVEGVFEALAEPTAAGFGLLSSLFGITPDPVTGELDATPIVIVGGALAVGAAVVLTTE